MGSGRVAANGPYPRARLAIFYRGRIGGVLQPPAPILEVMAFCAQERQDMFVDDPTLGKRAGYDDYFSPRLN